MNYKIEMILPITEQNNTVVSISGKDLPKNIKQGDKIRINSEIKKIVGIGHSRGSFSDVTRNLDLLIEGTNIKIGDKVSFI